MTNQTYIDIAVEEIKTQEQIELLIADSTSDESQRTLLRENIANAIRTHNFETELERH